jgi:hypothetical protein
MASAVSEFPRQALDATVLGFQHPRSLAPLRFERALRSDIMALVRVLGGDVADL